MGQHRLIICIERAYGNQVIVNSMDKMINIFGQRHGRKNFLDNIRTVARILKYAKFHLSFFSNDSSLIRWENGERLRLHPRPISTSTLSGTA